jgi:hypothetical protein
LHLSLQKDEEQMRTGAPSISQARTARLAPVIEP